MSGPTSPQTPRLGKLVKNVTTNSPTKEGELSSRIILMRSDYLPGFLINIITLERDICLEIDSVLITINYIDYKTQSNGFRWSECGFLVGVRPPRLWGL